MRLEGQQENMLQHRPRYRPDIEGLRGVAVLIVVAFHANFPDFGGGFVGVDVFFVLSGYLITWLLVNEAAETRSINFGEFYARRARRLLPALFAMLFVTLAISAFLYAPFEQRALARSWATTAAYVSNIDFATRALDYNGPNAAGNPLLHTWSLSVEEQFYLVWPLVIVCGIRLAPRAKRFTERGLVVLLFAVTGLSFGLSIYLTRSQPKWAFYLAPGRAWELGAGGWHS